MNNKCTYENILTLTKSLNMIYINGVIESSNESVRKVMEKGLTETLEIQDQIYQKMKSDGYYQVANVKESEIDKLYKKLTKDEG